jgi:hypothetical protein
VLRQIAALRQNKNIVLVAIVRRLLTLVYHGFRDGEIRRLRLTAT